MCNSLFMNEQQGKNKTQKLKVKQMIYIVNDYYKDIGENKKSVIEKYIIQRASSHL